MSLCNYIILVDLIAINHDLIGTVINSNELVTKSPYFFLFIGPVTNGAGHELTSVIVLSLIVLF